jgi:hypothetical protein
VGLVIVLVPDVTNWRTCGIKAGRGKEIIGEIIIAVPRYSYN